MAGDKERYARKKAEEKKQAQIKAVGSGANIITTVALTSTSANKQTVDAKNSGKTCKNFCRQKGFHILPVRYTVSADAPQMIATLGKNVKEIKISNFKYTVEMVNTGYIYSLVKRVKGDPKWSGYIVNDKGYLSYFNPGSDAAPSKAPDFGCNVGEHIIKASLVTIEEIPDNPADVVFIIHTHVPFSKAKLKEYLENAETFVVDGKWQKFEVSKWKHGFTSQEHSFSIKKTNIINNKKSYGTRLSETQKRFASFDLSIACMALYDPIGITKKLNEARNSQFKELMKYLAQKDENDFTNEHRLSSSASLDSLKLILEKGLIKQEINSDVLKDEQMVKLIYAQNKIPKYTNLNQIDYQKKMNEIWREASQAEKQKVLDEYNKKFEPVQFKEHIKVAAKAKAQLIWDEKYKPKINWVNKLNFDKKINELTQTGKLNANKYAGDHISWVKSKALLQALHVYEQNEVKEYGFLFHAHVMSLLHGISGFNDGQSLIEKWLSSEKIDDSNLLLRAVCYNQKALINKFNTCAPSLKTISWDQTQGLLKNTIAMFVAFDQLWDEWLTKGVYKIDELKWYNPAKSVYWISEITRTVTKWSLQYNANAKIAAGLSRISFIAYAHGTLLTTNVPKWSLIYNLDSRNLTAANKLNATDIQKKWTQPDQGEASRKIKELLSKSPDTVKIRISSIVALFELINLGTQSHKFNGEKNFENGFQVSAGLFASTAVVLDIAGGGAETLSFTQKANQIRIYGGGFAIVGATFSFLADSTAFGKEVKGDQDPYVMALSFAKATTSLLMLVVGFGLFLKLPLLEKSAISLAAKKMALTSWLFRVSLIRTVAYLNWVGVALTLLEIVLKIWFIPNDIQKWCMKTPFGVGEKKNKFKTLKDEEVEFSKVLESI